MTDTRDHEHTEHDKDHMSLESGDAAEINEFQEHLHKIVTDEVLKRRSLGQYPPAFELAMDKAFKRHAPNPGEASEYSAEHLLDMVEATGYIDILVPTKSSTPGVSFVKWSIKKLTAWYFNYITQQLSNFVVNLVHLLRVTHVRLNKLEKKVYELYPEILAAEIPVSLGVEIDRESDLLSTISAMYQDTKGRVLVTECASGNVIDTLTEAGFDTYGIDHRENLVSALGIKSDIRWETLGAHSKSLASKSLGGVVLQGSFELRSSNDKLDILNTIAGATRPTGFLLLLFHDPEEKYLSADLTVATELAPGQLFSTVTWETLLSKVGFRTVATGTITNKTPEKPKISYLVAKRVEGTYHGA